MREVNVTFPPARKGDWPTVVSIEADGAGARVMRIRVSGATVWENAAGGSDARWGRVRPGDMPRLVHFSPLLALVPLCGRPVSP